MLTQLEDKLKDACKMPQKLLAFNSRSIECCEHRGIIADISLTFARIQINVLAKSKGMIPLNCASKISPLFWPKGRTFKMLLINFVTRAE